MRLAELMSVETAVAALLMASGAAGLAWAFGAELALVVRAMLELAWWLLADPEGRAVFWEGPGRAMVAILSLVAFLVGSAGLWLRFKCAESPG